MSTSEALYSKKPEYIVLEISFGCKLLLCGMYRPPKAGHMSAFFDLVGNLLPTYSDVLIVGDFNVDLSTYRVFFDKTQLKSLVNDLNLSILPLEPTFHLPTSESWLDLLICNDITKVREFGQVNVAGISYHDLIYIELCLKVKSNFIKGVKCVRDFKNINEIKLKQDIQSVTWDDVLLVDDISTKVSVFSNEINILFDKHVPEKNIKIKKNPCPWIDAQIKSIMKDRDKLYSRYVKTKDPIVWENYRRLRNQVKRILRDSRNRHFNSLLRPDKQCKDIWNVINSQGVGKKEKTNVDVVVQLNDLNRYFCGVNNRVDEELSDYYRTQRGVFCNIESPFVFTATCKEEVQKMMFDISSNAVGDDGIHIRFLKLIFNEISDVLCHIFNYSLEFSVYPSQWKKSLVLPLPKSKTPSECKDYRPINLLSVLGKVLDKIVYNQICKYVNLNNILDKYQSGYRSHFSTQTALIKITDDIRRTLDNKKVCLLMLLDFSRAFDSVNHKLLLSILESYNFEKSVLKWFTDYLSDRQQRVKTQAGNISEWRSNSVGVPQGSTLSALLFSLYINKIGSSLIFCNYMMYADDMQLYIDCNINSVDDAVRSMNADLTTLHQWCTSHGLQLNISKCKPILFGSSRMLPLVEANNLTPLLINNVQLNLETNIVNLGLRMCNDLSWRMQVDSVYRKVFQCLYKFKRLCFNPPTHIKKLMVTSLILPIFDYANVAYCDLNNELTNKLQKAQNACIRYIYSLAWDQHVTPYYKDLGLLKIKERIELNVLKLSVKVHKHKKPEYLYDSYCKMSNVHMKNTRYAGITLQLPIHRTVMYNRSFHVTSIRLINFMEKEVRQNKDESDAVLLRKYKMKLLDRY